MPTLYGRESHAFRWDETVTCSGSKLVSVGDENQTITLATHIQRGRLGLGAGYTGLGVEGALYIDRPLALPIQRLFKTVAPSERDQQAHSGVPG